MARGARAVPKDRAYGAGGVKQRTVDAAIRDLGGRKSKAFQAARDFGDVARRAGDKMFSPSANPKVNRLASSRWNKALTALENATSGSRAATLAKASLRGLLSPAGLAEGVAGSAAQAVERKRFMKEAGEQGKPSKKSGMRKPHTKA